MSYTASDVKRLRELTAAGMMDCKNALDESGGDFDKAVELIRVKGQKGVTKRASQHHPSRALNHALWRAPALEPGASPPPPLVGAGHCCQR